MSVDDVVISERLVLSTCIESVAAIAKCKPMKYSPAPWIDDECKKVRDNLLADGGSFWET